MLKSLHYKQNTNYNINLQILNEICFSILKSFMDSHAFYKI